MSVKFVEPVPTDVPHRLLIDKISLTIKPPQWRAYSQYKDQLNNLATMEDPPIKYDPSGKVGTYTTAYRIKIGSLSHKDWPLLQIAKPKPNTSFIRLEFNPDHLGVGGIKELKALLDQQLILHGYPAVLKCSRVTRIDLAIDLLGLSLDQIFPRTKWPTYAETWSQFGNLETIYLGKRKQTKNFYRIYEHEGSGATSDKQLRVEREIRDHVGKLSELAGLGNPFTTLKINHLDMPAPKGWNDEAKWQLFLRVLKTSGALGALFMLPKDERVLAKNQFKLFPVKQVDLGAIWSEWPSVLQKTGLLTPGPEGLMMPYIDDNETVDET
jgi:hypothetical protein